MSAALLDQSHASGVGHSACDTVQTVVHAAHRTVVNETEPALKPMPDTDVGRREHEVLVAQHAANDRGSSRFRGDGALAKSRPVLPELRARAIHADDLERSYEWRVD